jgi:hypothetical protein
MKTGFVRAALVAGGLLYLITGLTQVFTPDWFYQNIGTFPPYNRHYIGDLGSFMLPLGIALLWAAREPARHRSLIAFAVAGSLLHAVNHAYDDLMAQTPLAGWLSATVPLLVLAVVLAGAYAVVQRGRAA